MLTDTHCHLYKQYYNDIEEVLNKAKQNGVNRFFNNGCDKESNVEVLRLINKHENMYGAIGIHPQSVNEYNEHDLEFLEHNLKNPKIVAIGEIGLDYYWVKDNKEAQKDLFEHQLQLAEKYQMPVIIHSREATLDVITTLKKYKVRGIIHSFSGSYETAMEYIKMGYLLGINGVVTFKNSKLKEVIVKLPLEAIVLETDSPYLTPEPYRGKKNEPAYVKNIVEYLAKLLHISELEIVDITNKNIARVFDI